MNANAFLMNLIVTQIYDLLMLNKTLIYNLIIQKSEHLINADIPFLSMFFYVLMAKLTYLKKYLNYSSTIEINSAL